MNKLGPGAPAELAGGEDIKFEEPAYSMGAGSQGDFDSPVLRLRYSSLSTPSSTIDYNMQTGQRCPPPLPASAAASLTLPCSCALQQRYWHLFRGNAGAAGFGRSSGSQHMVTRLCATAAKMLAR